MQPGVPHVTRQNLDYHRRSRLHERDLDLVDLFARRCSIPLKAWRCTSVLASSLLLTTPLCCRGTALNQLEQQTRVERTTRIYCATNA